MIDEWPNPVTIEEMYGDWDFDAAVEAVGRSLNPRPKVSFFDTVATLGIGSEDYVLDIGGRDGAHALAMAERFGCRCLSVDPVEANIDRGRLDVADNAFGHLVELQLGVIERIPAPDNTFDLVTSRDMLGHIEDLEVALSEVARVLRSGGAVVLHAVMATRWMEPEELRRLCADVASHPQSLSVAAFESAAIGSGLAVESVDVVGSEWVEASQEAGTAPNYLLQVSRLRRDKARLLEEIGEVAYRVVYGNALWSIYRLLGKLESRVYVLRTATE